MNEKINAMNKTLLIWDGPERPHKHRDRKFYTSMIALLLGISIFLILAGQYMIIILVLSLVFATYALYSTPPGKTTYVITSEGLDFKDEFIPWSKIDSYFVTKSLDGTVINIDLNVGSLLKRRYLIPDNADTMHKATTIIAEHVPKKMEQKKQSVLSKVTNKIGISFKEE